MSGAQASGKPKPAVRRAARVRSQMDDERVAMIAKIHVAKKQLALTDDCYRSVLKRVTGLDSTKAMTAAQLESMLTEFRRLGFTPKRRASDKPNVRLIWALWDEFKPFALNPTANGLRRFVERMTGKDDPEFLDPEQANQVIEGLKVMLRRQKAKHAIMFEGAP